jgi:hypothetical protein
MNEAMKVLLHAEAVLVKKIKAMKDGKPKYAANERINELRDAIKILKAVDELGGLTKELLYSAAGQP